VKEVRMSWGDRTEVVIENFRPSAYVINALCEEPLGELVPA
jgi:hypothetical protein